MSDRNQFVINNPFTDPVDGRLWEAGEIKMLELPLGGFWARRAIAGDIQLKEKKIVEKKFENLKKGKVRNARTI